MNRLYIEFTQHISQYYACMYKYMYTILNATIIVESFNGLFWLAHKFHIHEFIQFTRYKMLVNNRQMHERMLYTYRNVKQSCYTLGTKIHNLFQQ